MKYRFWWKTFATSLRLLWITPFCKISFCKWHPYIQLKHTTQMTETKVSRTCKSVLGHSGVNRPSTTISTWKRCFCAINFHGCKFCHILRGFLFSDGEVLDILRGLIFAITRSVMFMSNMIIAGEKQIFAKLPKIY